MKKIILLLTIITTPALAQEMKCETVSCGFNEPCIERCEDDFAVCYTRANGGIDCIKKDSK